MTELERLTQKYPALVAWHKRHGAIPEKVEDVLYFAEQANPERDVVFYSEDLKQWYRIRDVEPAMLKDAMIHAMKEHYPDYPASCTPRQTDNVCPGCRVPNEFTTTIVEEAGFIEAHRLCAAPGCFHSWTILYDKRG